MVTIFSTPKKFEGDIQVIQTNAITSWTRLKPSCEVILLGNEPGTAEIARKFNIKHVPLVPTNRSGTPLVNHLFRLAEENARHQILTYVNADIILTDDFLSGLRKVKISRFLLTGRRRSLWLKEYLDFSDALWQEKLKKQVRKSGYLESARAIDYFVFPKGLWKNLPPYTIGRAGYDNGLLYDAYSRNIPVINATRLIWAIHQNHTYCHHPQGRNGVYYGQEAEENLSFTGYGLYGLNINNASFILTEYGLLPACTFGHLRTVFRIATTRFSYPQFWLNLMRDIGENSSLLKWLEEKEAD